MSTANSSRGGLTRRSFLKTAGAAAGAVGLAGAASMTSTSGWLAPAQAHAEPEERVAYTFHYRHCQCNCHLKCTVRDGRMVLIEPNDWPNKRNETVCLKGISEIQHTYSADRIQAPLKRVGERGKGEFVQITWDEALDTIADKVKETWEKDGPQAIAFQTAVDSLTTFLPKLLKGQEKPRRGIDIGLGNGFSPALAESGQQGASSNEVTDWKNAKTILNVGCNMLETCMVTSKYFFDAKDAGSEIITIDPNFCTTAAKSSRWIPIVAGTDPALYLGMVSVILEKGWYNESYLKVNTSMPFLVKRSDGSLLRRDIVSDAAQTGTENPFMVWDEGTESVVEYLANGVSPALEHEAVVDGEAYATVFSLLKENQRQYTVAWASELTGIAEETLVELADKYANHGPSILSFGFGGGEKFYNADVAGHAAVLLATLVGSFGTDVPGWGAGAYVNSYQKIFGAGKFASWPLPSECKTAKAAKGSVDCRDDKSGIKFLWAQNGAFQQVAGNQNRTDEWARSLDFIVVQDIWHTPTVDWADIVLPVCSHFECDEEIGFVRALRGHVLLQQRVLDPLFESKTDFWIEREMAKRLGYGDSMPASQEELTRFQLENSTDKAVAGITLDEVVASKGVVALRNQPEIARSYSGQTYKTKSGKIDVYYEDLVSYGQALPTWEAPHEAYAGNVLRERYPLHMTQRRSRYFVHQNFMDATWIRQHYDPAVEMNPIDLAARGLVSGDTVEVFNDRGSFKCECVATEAVCPGMAIIVEGVWPKFMVEGNLQNVTNDAVNPRGKALAKGRVIPFNDTLVEVKKA
ncbi:MULTISPECIES: molybdopterin-dependent oxidoreductase [unclassified Adlercreutzia]|uniref:molybdopterin-dependent oxidoreductase n=1 Tax=unclassified Adlercreutzia TaxID=2636013 RepID=UPI0013EAD6E4|nr:MULTISPECIES: molybdopterin-dependent oxidoreductase [unclassified Adlercreutzia]